MLALPSRRRTEDPRRYVLVFEHDTSRVVPLAATGATTIGRGHDVAVQLSDRSVSRHHAVISSIDGRTCVRDLDSQNGTFVNGERVSGTHPLASSDVITVGNVTLVFHAGAAHADRESALGLEQLRRRAVEELERALAYSRPLAMASIAFTDRVADPRHVIDTLELRRIDAAAWVAEDLLWLVLPELDGAELTRRRDQLRAKLDAIAPGVRVGVAMCPTDGADVDSLFAAARADAVASTQPARGTDPGPRTITIGDRVAIVADPAMAQLYKLVERLAATELSVLVFGETGTGKDLTAHALHQMSRRAAQPLVSLNCAAIQETLVESELFGYERGAFSGAVAAKPGLLEVASGGTIFLDEIGELPLGVQAKLLRVLETRRLLRLGDVRERPIDLRIIAATNRDLEADVARGRFRQDLFFRLGAAMLRIPPLRDRPSELPLLAQSFLREACVRHGRPPMGMSPDTLRQLLTAPWPGNVRELKNLIDFLAATVPVALIEPWHLRGDIERRSKTTEQLPALPVAPAKFRPLAEEIEELERQRIAAALAAAAGNQRTAAAMLAMPLRTFVFKLRHYRLRRTDA